MAFSGADGIFLTGNSHERYFTMRRALSISIERQDSHLIEQLVKLVDAIQSTK